MTKLATAAITETLTERFNDAFKEYALPNIIARKEDLMALYMFDTTAFLCALFNIVKSACDQYLAHDTSCPFTTNQLIEIIGTLYGAQTIGGQITKLAEALSTGLPPGKKEALQAIGSITGVGLGALAGFAVAKGATTMLDNYTYEREESALKKVYATQHPTTAKAFKVTNEIKDIKTLSWGVKELGNHVSFQTAFSRSLAEALETNTSCTLGEVIDNTDIKVIPPFPLREALITAIYSNNNDDDAFKNFRAELQLAESDMAAIKLTQANDPNMARAMLALHQLRYNIAASMLVYLGRAEELQTVYNADELIKQTTACLQQINADIITLRERTPALPDGILSFAQTVLFFEEKEFNTNQAETSFKQVTNESGLHTRSEIKTAESISAKRNTSAVKDILQTVEDAGMETLQELIKNSEIEQNLSKEAKKAIKQQTDLYSKNLELAQKVAKKAAMAATLVNPVAGAVMGAAGELFDLLNQATKFAPVAAENVALHTANQLTSQIEKAKIQVNLDRIAEQYTPYSTSRFTSHHAHSTTLMTCFPYAFGNKLSNQQQNKRYAQLAIPTDPAYLSFKKHLLTGVSVENIKDADTETLLDVLCLECWGKHQHRNEIQKSADIYTITEDSITKTKKECIQSIKALSGISGLFSQESVEHFVQVSNAVESSEYTYDTKNNTRKPYPQKSCIAKALFYARLSRIKHREKQSNRAKPELPPRKAQAEQKASDAGTEESTIDTVTVFLSDLYDMHMVLALDHTPKDKRNIIYIELLSNKQAITKSVSQSLHSNNKEPDSMIASVSIMQNIHNQITKQIQEPLEQEQSDLSALQNQNTATGTNADQYNQFKEAVKKSNDSMIEQAKKTPKGLLEFFSFECDSGDYNAFTICAATAEWRKIDRSVIGTVQDGVTSIAKALLTWEGFFNILLPSPTTKPKHQNGATAADHLPQVNESPVSRATKMFTFDAIKKGLQSQISRNFGPESSPTVASNETDPNKAIPKNALKYTENGDAAATLLKDSIRSERLFESKESQMKRAQLGGLVTGFKAETDQVMKHQKLLAFLMTACSHRRRQRKNKATQTVKNLAMTLHQALKKGDNTNEAKAATDILKSIAYLMLNSGAMNLEKDPTKTLGRNKNGYTLEPSKCSQKNARDQLGLSLRDVSEIRELDATIKHQKLLTGFVDGDKNTTRNIHYTNFKVAQLRHLTTKNIQWMIMLAASYDPKGRQSNGHNILANDFQSFDRKQQQVYRKPGKTRWSWRMDKFDAANPPQMLSSHHSSADESNP